MNKTLNRFFVILVCISLLIGIIVFPASASSVDNSYNGNLVNYFDYYNGDLNFHLTQDNNSITFDLPTACDFRYLDFTFFCWAGYGLSDVIVEVGGTSQSLNRVNLSSGIIRAYGLTNASKSLQDHFTLTFVFSASTCDISFFSFKYSSITFESFAETVRMGILGTDRPSPISVSNSSNPIQFLENSDYSSFTGSIYLDNWVKYDYIDILLDVRSVGLTSVYVEADGIKVPFDISFFDSSFGAISFVNSDYGSDEWHYTYLGKQVNPEYVFIRVDLSTLVRDSSIPVIKFTGLWSENLSSSGSISLNSVYGYFQAETISPLGYFFKDLKNFLRDLFSPKEDVKEDISTGISNNESTEQDIMSGIDDIGSDPADIDIDVIIEQSGADTNLIAAFFSVFFNNVIILRTFWLAALFIVIGYIFHGQR